MIKSIYIENFILISSLKVELEKGFNVITGETGAGKSIIINAIDIALGAKASLDTIKTGELKAVIELVISVEDPQTLEFLIENGIDVQNSEIIVSREILPTTTRSRINGIMVTQDVIRELKERVLDIHSQHQAYTYIQPKYHVVLLDNFGDEPHKSLLAAYKELYKEYLEITSALQAAKANTEDTEKKIDFLKFQIDEIESAQINDFEEDAKLNSELEVLSNAEKLKEIACSAYYALYEDENSISTGVSAITSSLKKAVAFDSSLSQVEENISAAAEMLKDGAKELRSYFERLDSDPQRLDEIQERLVLLDKLKRKYGKTLEDVNNALLSFQKELSQIELSEGNLEALTKRLSALEAELEESAENLSSSRKDISVKLSALIEKELEKLEMPKVKFEVSVEKAGFNENGSDKVEFLISTNISEPLKPLSRVASGGEISRVMLAIKTIFAKADKVCTIVFDEIDTGISGRAAQAVADAIELLSASHQIISITHQPVIAAKAGNHLYVVKKQSDTTEVQVHTLNDENKIKAIATLASGEITQESMEFARKLVN